MKWFKGWVIVLVALAIGIAIGWFLGHIEPGAKIEDLVAQLSTKNEQLEEARGRWEVSQSEVADKEADLKKWKAKAKNLRPRLDALRLRTGQLGGLKSALAPRVGTLASARLVRGETHDLLLVAWRVERIGRRFLPRSGLEVWRLSQRTSLDVDDSFASTWQMVYSIEPRPTREGGSLVAGPPGAQTEQDSYSSSAFIADIGDVTHDGMPDLVIQDWGSGTGGCGVVRVFDNAASGLREIFHRDDCDHHIYIKAGSIGYRTALFPPGCDASAHGCGWKRTWMRWNGSSWEVTNVRRKLY